MSRFILEILSEEIPAKFQDYALIKFSELFFSEFRKLGLFEYDCFVTPRRIVVTVCGVDKNIVIKKNDKKGPRVGSAPEIVESFAESVGCVVSDLYIAEVSGKNYYFYRTKESEVKIGEALVSISEKILGEFTWPNTMRWGNYDFGWVRPIKSLLCMLDKDVLQLKFHHYVAGNITKGRCIDPGLQPIVVPSADSYFELIKSDGVILSDADRKEKLNELFRKIEKEQECEIEVEEWLFDEVTRITEDINVLVGSFDEKFLDLPDRIIKTVITSHQRVFPVYKEGELLNKFVVVASVANPTVLKGYQRVISARLADAVSMVEMDIKLSLEAYIPKLKNIVFHQKLGDYHKKVERLVALSKIIAFWVPNSSVINVERAAYLAKADLVTSFVRDFPKLAGFIGCYYLSIAETESPEVLNAVMEHTLPLDASGKCPFAPVTVPIALSDKMDNLVGLIIAGEKVTSTRDPLGMRRNAIAILRLIIENNLDIPLKVVVMKSVDLYPSSLFMSLIKRKSNDGEGPKFKKNEAIEQIMSFFRDRLKALLMKDGVKSEVFEAVAVDIDHPLRLRKKSKVMTEWITSEQGLLFMEAYKRIFGVLKSVDDSFKAKYNKKLLKLPAEMNLISEFEQAEVKFEKLHKKHEYREAFSVLEVLAKPLNEFMDAVVINVDEQELKKSRVGLLKLIMQFLESVCHFEMLKN